MGLEVQDHGSCPLPCLFSHKGSLIHLSFSLSFSSFFSLLATFPSSFHIPPLFPCFIPALFHGRLEATAALSPPPDPRVSRPAPTSAHKAAKGRASLRCCWYFLGAVSPHGSLGVPSSPTLLGPARNQAALVGWSPLPLLAGAWSSPGNKERALE